MKLWKRLIDARIRKEVMIAEQQFGFMLEGVPLTQSSV